MAVNTSYDTIKIRTALYSSLATLNICNDIFVGSRPSSIPATMSKFMVIKIANIDDHVAMGETMASIFIYVKNQTGGIEDSSTQSSLFQSIIATLPINTTNYRFHYNTNSSTVQDGLGFSVQIINLLTIIKHD